MKSLVVIVTVIFSAFSALATNGKGNSVSFEVDTKESKVFWTGKKVTGEHTGYVNLGGGTVFVNGDNVEGAEITMDMTTIEVTDLQGEWKDKLVGHLKSDDFFSVEKFPTAKFEIVAINKTAEGKHEVEGKLTMKGMTHKVAFPAQVKVSDGKVKASGTASIDRTLWDIKYGSGKFFSDLGDRMINDEFEIRFELVAVSATEVTSK